MERAVKRGLERRKAELVSQFGVILALAAAGFVANRTPGALAVHYTRRR